jgi:homoserine kinase
MPVVDPPRERTPGERTPGERTSRAGLRPGVVATVRVPATSANLGPGFDSLGLALGVHDTVRLELAPSGLEVEVRGVGAGAVPTTEDHLIARAVRAALDHLGLPQPGLRLTCHNAIPHGRGLGSSAAAVVAGLVAARGVLAEPEWLDYETVLSLATAFEGHPDNAAAALLGGCTISWYADNGVPMAERVDVHADIDPVVCVPSVELATSIARAMLPPTVPHADAAFNAGRAALLVQALARRPGLLMEATHDRLHQTQRAPAMPESAHLVQRIREFGGAAVVSGAGPSVLVLGVGDQAMDAVRSTLAGPGSPDSPIWTVLRPGVDTVGALLATEGD